KVGSHNNFLAYSHIAHDCVIGDYVVASNYCGISGHVHIGDHVILGGISGIHQFCRIGDYAMIGGMAKIVQDVPPYMIVDGNPAETRTINKIGLERNGFDAESISLIRSMFKLLYKNGLNREQAIGELEKMAENGNPLVTRMLTFVRTTDRGIC
ncbi:MAG: acyl-[acyl-carrier-protein]--UDP-N-acetylglucosamine O-acyltransferase, partial [Opitutales bacterium]